MEQVPVRRQVVSKYLYHILLERGVKRAVGVDFADGQVGSGLLRNQDIDSIVLLFANDNDQAEIEKLWNIFS